ncbi:FUSC family protein [Agrococcus carbonis]|uniref:FUSC family protein n=1 Tax=Agrococcus carbonis TaxID=684552 RepID=UPI000B848D53|nr:hypothetical protein [Agrococcus carbonis]
MADDRRGSGASTESGSGLGGGKSPNTGSGRAVRLDTLRPSNLHPSKLRAALLRWFPPHRIATALRAALAAMAAWLVGNLLPGDVAQYSYAAPLGAFVATGTSFFSIARAALQQSVALAIGAALGLALFSVEMPGLLKIGIIAAVAVLLPGAAALGTSASVVPVAALLVIMFGSVDPDGYAAAYVGEFTIGLIVGVLVNALARPPIWDAHARKALLDQVEGLADRVETLAELLRGDWPPEREDWADWGPVLEAGVERLDRDLQDARESRRLNPRTLWHREDVTPDAEVAALRAIVHRTIDVLDTASGAAWAVPIEVRLDAEARPLVADALQGLSGHLRAWASGKDVADASAASEEAIRALAEHVATHDRPDPGLGTIIFALRAIRERIGRVTEEE